MNSLISALENLGYQVKADPSESMSSWITKENALLYGNPSCLEAIDDIRVQTGAIANLSELPLIRFGSDDQSYNAPNIVIQLIDNSFIP